MDLITRGFVETYIQGDGGANGKPGTKAKMNNRLLLYCFSNQPRMFRWSSIVAFQSDAGDRIFPGCDIQYLLYFMQRFQKHRSIVPRVEWSGRLSIVTNIVPLFCEYQMVFLLLPLILVPYWWSMPLQPRVSREVVIRRVAPTSVILRIHRQSLTLCLVQPLTNCDPRQTRARAHRS